MPQEWITILAEGLSPYQAVVRSARGGDDLTGILISLGVFLFLICLGLVVGRRIEKRHMADLRVRQEGLRDMVVTDLRSFPLRDTMKPGATLLIGEVVIASDYLKNFLAGLKNIFGGNVRGLETLTHRAREEAKLRLVEQARAAGYNAVCNLRLETADVGGETKGQKRKMVTVGVIASGTAYHAKQ